MQALSRQYVELTAAVRLLILDHHCVLFVLLAIFCLCKASLVATCFSVSVDGAEALFFPKYFEYVLLLLQFG